MWEIRKIVDSWPDGLVLQSGCESKNEAERTLFNLYSDCKPYKKGSFWYFEDNDDIILICKSSKNIEMEIEPPRDSDYIFWNSINDILDEYSKHLENTPREKFSRCIYIAPNKHRKNFSIKIEFKEYKDYDEL